MNEDNDLVAVLVARSRYSPSRGRNSLETAARDNGQVTGDLYAYSGTDPTLGDSGGPIYYPYNGGALIGGTIVGPLAYLAG